MLMKMRPEIRLTMLAALGVALPFASTEEVGTMGKMSLSEFQGVLRTSLDSEVAKIVEGSRSAVQHHAMPSDHRDLHEKRRSNVRRRTAEGDRYEQQDTVSTSPAVADPTLPAERVWDDLLHHAWNVGRTIKRGEQGGLSVTPNPDEAHPFPFLVCTRRRQGAQLDSNSVDDIVASFGKQYEDALLVSSSHSETCLILTATASQVHQVVEIYEYERGLDLVAMPLLDIAKIHAGTIDEVSSPGWSVPFVEQVAEQEVTNNMNETETINHWERVVVVDFVPGLGGGGLKEESELLDVVNGMMGDIQDMGEVGWLRSMGKEEAEGYLVEESLVGVPALSDLFSLTSSLVSINDNESDNSRIAFWRDSLKKGIESEHACSEMFSVLFVKPRAGYYGYDLVLNPSDGPPPREYESSASNPACVTSLIAALSAHPYVLSVKANFPIYHGWNIAQKLDSAQ